MAEVQSVNSEIQFINSDPILFTTENIDYFLKKYKSIKKNDDDEFPYSIKTFHDLKGTKPPLELKKELESEISISCGGFITTDYIKEQVYNLLTSPHFDAIFIYNHTTNELVGSLIVSNNECKVKPDIFSIQLICSNENMLQTSSSKKFGSVGSIIMGLFLVLVKKNGMVSAILEIAKSYLNVKAYCLYTKFGFRYNPELYGTLLKKRAYIPPDEEKKGNSKYNRFWNMKNKDAICFDYLPSDNVNMIALETDLSTKSEKEIISKIFHSSANNMDADDDMSVCNPNFRNIQIFLMTIHRILKYFDFPYFYDHYPNALIYHLREKITYEFSTPGFLTNNFRLAVDYFKAFEYFGLKKGTPEESRFSKRNKETIRLVIENLKDSLQMAKRLSINYNNGIDIEEEVKQFFKNKHFIYKFNGNEKFVEYDDINEWIKFQPTKEKLYTWKGEVHGEPNVAYGEEYVPKDLLEIVSYFEPQQTKEVEEIVVSDEIQNTKPKPNKKKQKSHHTFVDKKLKNGDPTLANNYTYTIRIGKKDSNKNYNEACNMEGFKEYILQENLTELLYVDFILTHEVLPKRAHSSRNPEDYRFLIQFEDHTSLEYRDYQDICSTNAFKEYIERAGLKEPSPSTCNGLNTHILDKKGRNRIQLHQIPVDDDLDDDEEEYEEEYEEEEDTTTHDIREPSHDKRGTLDKRESSHDKKKAIFNALKQLKFEGEDLQRYATHIRLYTRKYRGNDIPTINYREGLRWVKGVDVDPSVDLTTNIKRFIDLLTQGTRKQKKDDYIEELEEGVEEKLHQGILSSIPLCKYISIRVKPDKFGQNRIIIQFRKQQEGGPEKVMIKVLPTNFVLKDVIKNDLPVFVDEINAKYRLGLKCQTKKIRSEEEEKEEKEEEAGKKEEAKKKDDDEDDDEDDDKEEGSKKSVPLCKYISIKVMRNRHNNFDTKLYFKKNRVGASEIKASTNIPKNYVLEDVIKYDLPKFIAKINAKYNIGLECEPIRGPVDKTMKKQPKRVPKAEEAGKKEDEETGKKEDEETGKKEDEETGKKEEANKVKRKEDTIPLCKYISIKTRPNRHGNIKTILYFRKKNAGDKDNEMMKVIPSNYVLSDVKKNDLPQFVNEINAKYHLELDCHKEADNDDDDDDKTRKREKPKKGGFKSKSKTKTRKRNHKKKK
jgi:hypothetical protein